MLTHYWPYIFHKGSGRAWLQLQYMYLIKSVWKDLKKTVLLLLCIEFCYSIIFEFELCMLRKSFDTNSRCAVNVDAASMTSRNLWQVYFQSPTSDNKNPNSVNLKLTFDLILNLGIWIWSCSLTNYHLRVCVTSYAADGSLTL